jgi:cobyrinic acid a,c-diamide synthase
MYLGKALIDKEGRSFPMVNFLDMDTSMEKARLSLGYRTISIDNTVLAGHEFHYSTCIERSAITSIGDVFNSKGIRVSTPVYLKKNVIASYIHFYWAENFKLIEILLRDKQLKSEAKPEGWR